MKRKNPSLAPHAEVDEEIEERRFFFHSGQVYETLPIRRLSGIANSHDARKALHLSWEYTRDRDP